MSKISARVLLLILQFIFLLSPSSVVYAASCNIKLVPTQPTTSTSTIQITMQSSTLPSGKRYFYYVTHVRPGPLGIPETIRTGFPITEAQSVNLGSGLQTFYTPPNGFVESGTYKFELYDSKPALFGTGIFGQVDPNNLQCSTETTVEEPSKNPNCKIDIKDSENLTVDKQVEIAVSGLNEAGNFTIDIANRNTNQIIATKAFGVYSVSPIFNYKLDPLPPGNYKVGVRQDGTQQCPATNFQVKTRFGEVPAGSTTGICLPGERNCSTSAGVQCNTKDGSSDPKGDGVLTAIGCIPTQPKPLIEGILKFSAAIGGGIAFLLIISGVFQFITSAGNQDRLKKASEQITNSVIGLLFIIFSVLLLRIIGVDILGVLPP